MNEMLIPYLWRDNARELREIADRSPYRDGSRLHSMAYEMEELANIIEERTRPDV